MPLSSAATCWESYYQRRAPLPPLTSAEASLSLVAQTGLALDAPILDVGCGTSAFLAGLSALRYANLLATDISSTALAHQRQQLGDEAADRILWLEDDVTNPRQLAALQPILLWHDHGLLHGLTTIGEQRAYRRLLDHMVLPGGWLILATQAPPASGVPAPAGRVAYDASHLAALLGPAYRLQQHVQQLYRQLDEQAIPYTYALFQRDGQAPAGFRQTPFGTV